MTLFAEGLPNARFLRFTPSGDLLVSLPRSGRIVLLTPDADGDGRSDGRRDLVEGLDVESFAKIPGTVPERDLALGVQALSSSDLRRRVRPLLRILARESGETATLEVPVENSMLVLDEVTGRHVVAATANIGTRWPMHATSTGKIWLAFDEGSLAQLDDQLEAVAPRTLTQKSALVPQISDIRVRGYAETIDDARRFKGFFPPGGAFHKGVPNERGRTGIHVIDQRLHQLRAGGIGILANQTMANRL